MNYLILQGTFFRRHPLPGDFLKQGFLVGTMLLLFRLLWVGLQNACYLPESAYRESSFLVAFFTGSLPGSLLLATILTAFLLRKRLRLAETWQELDSNGTTGILMRVLVGLLAWFSAAYGFNALFGHWHWGERLLALLLAVLCLRKPAAVLPLTVLVFLIAGQFRYPFGMGYERPILDLLTGGLVLFSVFFLLSRFSRAWQPRHFLFAFGCLVATHYWVPGWEKLTMGWWPRAQIHFILPAAYTHGWLAFLGSGEVAAFSSFLAPLDRLMATATLLLECGSLLLFVHKKLTALFLGGWIFFHLGVFTMTGFLFWTWMLVDALLLFLFFRRGHTAGKELWQPALALLAIPVIGLGQWWAAPAKLAWLDTRLSYAYRLQATDYQGNLYDLPPGIFGPYYDLMTFSNFRFLCPRRQLVGPYGATRSEDIANGLFGSRQDSAVFGMEPPPGRDSMERTQKCRRFFDLVLRFAGREAQGGGPTLLKWLQPPRHFLSFSRYSALPAGTAIKNITITRVTGFFDDLAYREIRHTPIARLTLADNLDAP
ncbi:MAG: hypothetical protein KDI06_12950 [Calditrichaeota bacterium]|nr:hypothetical protein [Calditrichota bacterium]